MREAAPEPYGGSRWARFFAGPRIASTCHPEPESLEMLKRLRAAAAATVPCSVAMLPTAPQRFTLNNCASLSGFLRARRFTLVAPESTPSTATAALLARATLVLLADPGDAGLLGLCPPGTKVLEIAPEGWTTSHTRALCAALGLNWHLFLATPLSYPLLGTLPFGARTPLSYEVPLGALGQTLAAL